MIRANSMMIASGTLLCALGIGYVLQYGLALPGGKHRVGPVEVTGIQDISGPATPRPPAIASVLPAIRAGAAVDAVFRPQDAASLPARSVSSGAPASGDVDAPRLPRHETAASNVDCDAAFIATPTEGALVRLSLDAPCHAGERVTLHHNGLMVTEVLGADGKLETDFPALAENAVFIAAFGEAQGAVAHADVPALANFDRVVVQWHDPSGLELHARERGAEYFGAGHVWHGAPGVRAPEGEAGASFMLRLGHEHADAPRLAEVYTIRSGEGRDIGAIDISVEVEVTDANCGDDLSAQIIELRAGMAPTLRDLTLSIPGCDSVGDYLVLNNLRGDLKIAAN